MRWGCGGRKVRWKGKLGWGGGNVFTSGVVTPGVGVDVAASSVVVDVAASSVVVGVVVCCSAEGG